MTRPQVRLDADVAEALGRDVERKGGSLSDATNRWLRRALGLQPTSTTPRPVDRRPAAIVPARGHVTPYPKPGRRVGR